MNKNLPPKPAAWQTFWLPLLALLFGSSPAFAQTPTGYCVTGLGGSCGGSNITDVSLLGTTLNATGLTCTGVGGQAYTAYPAAGSTTATLAGGNNYTLSVTTDGASILSVWVDYNRNGQLEATEWSQIIAASVASVPATVSLNVPVNAVQGQTIMRVRSRLSGNQNGASDACLSFGSGEAKDFTVTIGAPAACPTASNAGIGSITANSAALTFATSPSATGGYTVTTTPQGGTASTQTVTASPVSLSGLLPNTTYTVAIVSSCAGSTTSAVLTLQFTTLPTPTANNDCTAAVAVPVTATCATPTAGTVLGASQSLPPTTSCGTGIATANDVWFSFVAGGTSQTITLNPRFPAVLDVRAGNCATSASQFCATAFTGNTAANLVGGLTAGQTYFIRVYPSGTVPPVGVSSTFTLCITPGPTPAANDECTAAVAVPVTATCATPTAGTVAGASQSLAPTTSCGFGTTANDVWFSFVAGGPTQAITLNPRFSAILDVRSGTCVATANQFCTTAPVGNTAGVLVGGLTAGQSYFIRVYPSSSVPPVGANAAFTLCINPGPTPLANDECAGAIALPLAATCATPTAGSVAGASQSLPPSTTCGFGTTANDVWFSFVANAANVAIEASAVTGAILELRSGSCTTSVAVSCVTLNAGVARTALFGGLTAGQTYFLRLYSTIASPAGAAAGFTLCATAAPAAPVNDDCAGALPLPVQFGATCQTQTVGDNTAATGSAGAPAPTCASYQGGDLWYALTIPAGGSVTVSTDAPTAGSSITDTGLSIYSGTCTSLTEISCNDDSRSGLFSQIALTGRTPGEVVYVRVWAYNGSNTGRIALCALAPSNCAAPTSPAATNVTPLSATLNWAGSTPLPAGNTYEIEYGVQGFTLGTGTRVLGLTATTFSLTNLTPVTDYCFYVRQNCGATNGSSAYVGPTCFSTPQRVPTNDEPCGAIALANGSSTTDNNTGATTSLQPGITLPACSPAAAPKDVWFRFNAAQTTSALALTGAAAGMVRVFSAADCALGPFVQVGCASSGANNVGVPALALTGLVVGRRYYVAVSGYGSSNTTGSFTLSATNVLAARAQADTEALLVYPNPSATGQLTLRLTLGNASGPARLTLLNALGQTVLAQTAAVSNGSLERSLGTRGLAAGVYTLHLEVAGQLLTRKVVLE